MILDFNSGNCLNQKLTEYKVLTIIYIIQLFNKENDSKLWIAVSVLRCDLSENTVFPK